MEKWVKDPTIFKVIMLGEYHSGKTSVLNQYYDDTYTKRFKDTCKNQKGVREKRYCYDPQLQKFVLNTNKDPFWDDCKGQEEIHLHYKVQIWDTSGHEKNRNLFRSYYHDNDGVILVYDITNRSTFVKLSKWIKEIDNNMEGCQVVLVGNKLDRIKQTFSSKTKHEPAIRQVSFDEGLKLAHKHGFSFFEASAKTHINLSEAFSTLVSSMITTQNRLPPPLPSVHLHKSSPNTSTSPPWWKSL